MRNRIKNFEISFSDKQISNLAQNCYLKDTKFGAALVMKNIGCYPVSMNHC